MVHKNRRRPEEMLDLYRKSQHVPVAWQLFVKDRVTNQWHPLGQQRKYQTDAEKDRNNIFVGLNPIARAEFKEFKVIQVPASPGELWQRRVLRTLQKYPTLRGFAESFVGVAEFKVGSVQGVKFLPI